MRAFADLHRQRRADASLAITWARDSTRYGQVVVREDDRVYRFAEKQTSHSGGQSGWINAGIYLLNRNLVEEIPGAQTVSLECDMLPRWVRPGSTRNVFAYRCRGPFLDIGTAESYERAESFFNGLRGGAARESMPTRDCVPARQT
jgi:NDP-sugar pyrophosphorylase family protein